MTTEEIKQLVVNKANQYGINPNISLAQMARESDGFRQDVVFGPFVGGAGERGISQFTPGTWQRFGAGPHTNAYDPNLALDAWGKYMTFLLTTFGGDYLYALIGYNGGEGHLLNPQKHGPPSAAAQRYGQEVMARAGVGSGSGVDVGPIIVEPLGGDDFPWLPVAVAAGLLFFVALQD